MMVHTCLICLIMFYRRLCLHVFKIDHFPSPLLHTLDLQRRALCGGPEVRLKWEEQNSFEEEHWVISLLRVLQKNVIDWNI